MACLSTMELEQLIQKINVIDFGKWLHNLYKLRIFLKLFFVDFLSNSFQFMLDNPNGWNR